MRSFLLFLLLMIAHLVYGQKDSLQFTIVDRFCTCPEFEWSKGAFRLYDLKESDADTELRIQFINHTQFKDIFVIKEKAGKLEANYYYKRIGLDYIGRGDSLMKYGKWEWYPFYKFNMNTLPLKNILKEFSDSKIFSLPDQSRFTLNKSHHYYFIEYKRGKEIRSYSFGAPIDPQPENFPIYPEFLKYQQIAILLQKITSENFKIAVDYWIAHPLTPDTFQPPD